MVQDVKYMTDRHLVKLEGQKGLLWFAVRDGVAKSDSCFFELLQSTQREAAYALSIHVHSD